MPALETEKLNTRPKAMPAAAIQIIAGRRRASRAHFAIAQKAGA